MWFKSFACMYEVHIHTGCPGSQKNKCFFFPQDGVSPCSPGCPGTHSVDQDGLEFRNPPASASKVLGLKACATTAQPFLLF